MNGSLRRPPASGNRIAVAGLTYKLFPGSGAFVVPGLGT